MYQGTRIFKVMEKQMPWLRKRRPSHSSDLYNRMGIPKEKNVGKTLQDRSRKTNSLKNISPNLQKNYWNT